LEAENDHYIDDVDCLFTRRYLETVFVVRNECAKRNSIVVLVKVESVTKPGLFFF